MTDVIKIYSKKGCQQCIAAENACMARKLPYQVLKLDRDYRLEDLQTLTGKRSMSMPVVVLADGTVTDNKGLIASLKR